MIPKRQPVPMKLFKAGKPIFSEGDTADCMYVVRSGKVELYVGNKDNKKTLAVLGTNELFGEMGLVDDKPRSATALAVEDTQCLLFYKTEVTRRMEQADPFIKILVKVLSNTVRASNKRS